MASLSNASLICPKIFVDTQQMISVCQESFQFSMIDLHTFAALFEDIFSLTFQRSSYPLDERPFSSFKVSCCPSLFISQFPCSAPQPPSSVTKYFHMQHPSLLFSPPSKIRCFQVFDFYFLSQPLCTIQYPSTCSNYFYVELIDVKQLEKLFIILLRTMSK